jgi:hypothetical protein
VRPVLENRAAPEAKTVERKTFIVGRIRNHWPTGNLSSWRRSGPVIATYGWLVALWLRLAQPAHIVFEGAIRPRSARQNHFSVARCTSAVGET